MEAPIGVLWAPFFFSMTGVWVGFDEAQSPPQWGIIDAAAAPLVGILFPPFRFLSRGIGRAGGLEGKTGRRRAGGLCAERTDQSYVCFFKYVQRV